MGTNVFLNGKITDIKDAVIPATDRGFLYGDGVFETVRIYNGHPFQLQSHLKRLEFGANQLDINLPEKDEIEKSCQQLIRENNSDNTVLRITVSKGTTSKRVLVEDGLTPNILIQTNDLPDLPESFYKEGAKAITTEDNRGDFCHIKSTNLIPNIISKKQAHKDNAFEAILVSKRGFITEGTTTNVFGIIDGTLITPPAGKKVLNGTTRQVIIKIAKEIGVRIEEDALMSHELSIVSELFLTNSIIELMPVSMVDGKPVNDGKVGNISNQLLDGYKTVVDNWLKTKTTAVPS